MMLILIYWNIETVNIPININIKMLIFTILDLTENNILYILEK